MNTFADTAVNSKTTPSDVSADINDSHRRLLGIAADLFAERGYYAVSMRDLCEASGIGRGTIYHYINSKEDLLYHIAKEYIQDLLEVGMSEVNDDLDPRVRLTMLGRILVEKIASHQKQLTVCFREVRSLTEPRYSEVMSYHSRYEQLWRRAMMDGAEMGLFEAFDSIVLKAVLGMYFYSYIWIRGDGRPSEEHVAGKLSELTLRMLQKHR